MISPRSAPVRGSAGRERGRGGRLGRCGTGEVGGIGGIGAPTVTRGDAPLRDGGGTAPMHRWSRAATGARHPPAPGRPRCSAGAGAAANNPVAGGLKQHQSPIAPPGHELSEVDSGLPSCPLVRLTAEVQAVGNARRGEFVADGPGGGDHPFMLPLRPIPEGSRAPAILYTPAHPTTSATASRSCVRAARVKRICVFAPCPASRPRSNPKLGIRLGLPGFVSPTRQPCAPRPPGRGCAAD